MEQPFHSMRAVPNRFTPQKAVGFVAAVLLQAGFVYAIISGLAGQLISKLPEELKVAVEQEKIPPKAPPPPPPQLDVPPPPFVPPPDIIIQTEAPATNAITTQSVVKQQPQPPQPTELVPIKRTHTLPPYPPLALKLEQQGTTTMKVTISTSGDVTSCEVTKSAGSDTLDQAACSYVQARWRWQPPTQNGQPIAISTLVAVTWNLKNAR